MHTLIKKKDVWNYTHISQNRYDIYPASAAAAKARKKYNNFNLNYRQKLHIHWSLSVT